MELSLETRKIFEKAGWTPNRQINVELFKEALATEGYEIFDKANDFLSEFGGLEVIHPAYKVQNEMDMLHFDPIRAIEGIYHERVETYEERIGEKLIVIGEGNNGQLVLMISESGKIFGAYDDYLTCLGNNTFEALEALCENKETPQIN